MLKVIGCITQEHDWRFVLLAAGICALGCLTATTLMARATAHAGRPSVRPLLVAALLFGSSIWSLHFVAMLAYLPNLPSAYEPVLTALSIGIAIGGAALALLTWRATWGRRGGIVLSGALLGLAVAGMHYAGVAAMRLPARIAYDPAYVAASLLVGMGFGIVALHRAGGLSRPGRRAEVAAWLALSITGLHFTGMTALDVEIGLGAGMEDGILGTDLLGVLVGGVSLLILVASLVATTLGDLLSQRTIQELGRMRLLSDLAQEAMLIHRDGRVLEANSAASRLFGLAREGIIGRQLLDLFAPESTPALIRRGQCRAEDRRPEEFEILTAGGRQVSVEFSCQEILYDGRPATAAALRDLSDRKRDAARIRHLAHHDALTNLPNRFLLEERLTLAVDAARLGEARVAVLHLGLDRFKTVNDMFGHAAGDRVLLSSADRLRAELRSIDTLARVSGDEFVVVLPYAGAPEHVSEAAGRLIAAIDAPFPCGASEVRIGVSVGIALHPMDGETPEALLQSADTAMQRAKEEGSGGPRFFEASMNAEAQQRREMESELRHAVARGEMELHYQPVVSLRTGEIGGFEALVRWRHPGRGLVPPGEFIPLAEETGLILGIGQWVIEEACRAAAGWEEPWWVAVNLSPAQFRQPGLPRIVTDALAAAGLDARRLELEITEGVLIQDAAQAVEVLTDLRALGLHLALDDFGTGYSSLSYLRLFALDKIKVDRSFVQELGQSRETTMIVNTIINLGHNLGHAITVEGVETPAQLAVLRAQGCDMVQGYLLGRPAAGAPPGAGERARLRALVLGAHPPEQGRESPLPAIAG